MEIQQLPITSVFPSPMNPRKTFSEEDLRELADNIERQGLLQPITVRPIRSGLDFALSASAGVPIDGRPVYEIVCGERRYRAFKTLNEKWSDMDSAAPLGASFNRFSEIAAIVRDMDDDEAFDAMITENLQRKDVDPIEEAFAFGQLAKTGKTAEEIAARFGKSVRFVVERIKLNTLIPELMLAVKEERMPIVAAQMICKLDAEAQGKYLSRHSGNLTKATAESFTSNLFMNIRDAVWNGSDQGYRGGCGTACSECRFNTANHGCLFYEMRCSDSGRCTDRSRFNAKSRSFLMDTVRGMSEVLVRKGKPLEYGKTVLAVPPVQSYEGTETAELKRRLLEDLSEEGYEVVDVEKAFKSKCWYSNDDPRTTAMISSGEVYRVLSLFNYSTPKITEQYWYVKGFGRANETVDEGNPGDVPPIDVGDLLERIERKKASLKTSLTVEGFSVLNDCTPSDRPLEDDERVMLLTCMLVNNTGLCLKAGIPSECSAYSTKLREHLAVHPEIHDRVMHLWLHQQLNGSDACMKMAEDSLERLASLHCPEEVKAALDKVRSRHDKEIKKLTERLSELGYGPDGRKLTGTPPKPKKEPVKGYCECREKFPDSLLIFRIGDFYECFDDDAVKAAEVLGITLTKRTEHQLAGFPHHALDSYLPKFVKAGIRVAICEDLEKPKGKRKQV